MRRIDTETRYIAKTDAIRVWEESRGRSFPDFYNKHEGYEIVLVLSGECQVCAENRKYLLRPGDALFLAEGEYHCVNVPERCTFRYVDLRPHLIFSHPQYREILMRPFMAGQSGGSHKIAGNKRLTRSLLRLIEAAENARTAPLGVLRELVGLLEIFRLLKSPAQTALFLCRNRVRNAMELIHTRYCEEISISEMASACALSRASFYRHFLKGYGTGPREYINDLRMDRTAFLLISTARKVADIAMSTGYQNLSYFNRAFRKKTGTTPLGYRVNKGKV